MKRINEKIDEIQVFCQELQGMVPESFGEYVTDLKTKAACERYAEKIVEALVDLALLAIKHEGLEAPEQENDSFALLEKAGLISEELAEKLQNAKGMRNILAHQYGAVNDEIIFHAVSSELTADAKEFIKQIEKL